MNHLSLHNTSERGGVGLAAVIFLLFAVMTVAALMAADTFRQTKIGGKSFTTAEEKLNARSNAAIMAQIVERDANPQLTADVNQARQKCGLPTVLPIFDENSLSSGGAQSVPAAVVSDAAGVVCTGRAQPTSVFGVLTVWSKERIKTLEKTAASKFSINTKNVGILSIEEVYRRKIIIDSNSESTYVARYAIEAKSGNYRTRTAGEVILGADIPGCGTSLFLTASPATVAAGSFTTLTVRYRYASNIKIYNKAGLIVDERNITEQEAEQTYSFAAKVDVDEEFYAVAGNSGGCIAQSVRAKVEATPVYAVGSGCPTINSFTASSQAIRQGGSVTISWVVQNASKITVNGEDVTALGASASKTYPNLQEDTIFTLRAVESAAEVCPVNKQLLVRVNLVADCTTAPPVINTFSASVSNPQPGETITLTRNVSRLSANNRISILFPDGTTSTGLSAVGTINVRAPIEPGEYTYLLSAGNLCPAGESRATREIKITILPNCQKPQLNIYSVNPSQVLAGGNENIAFNWNVSGKVDSISIDNGVGSNLPTTGLAVIRQPQSTTTYTITAFGCGAATTAQRQVIVSPSGSGNQSSYKATWLRTCSHDFPPPNNWETETLLIDVSKGVKNYQETFTTTSSPRQIIDIRIITDFDNVDISLQPGRTVNVKVKYNKKFYRFVHVRNFCLDNPFLTFNEFKSYTDWDIDLGSQRPPDAPFGGR